MVVVCSGDQLDTNLSNDDKSDFFFDFHFMAHSNMFFVLYTMVYSGRLKKAI